MKVKRFFARTMAEALKQVSQDMGPDAVILSNRRVDGGVEIVTALDYDENMARQRLGEKADEATSGARLAELQAEQHRRLEDELQRSRERIREIREQRSQPAETMALDDLGLARAMADEPAPVASAPVGDYSRELARMREEISSLRELVRGQQPDAAPRPGLVS